jgi:hypothetical protein
MTYDAVSILTSDVKHKTVDEITSSLIALLYGAKSAFYSNKGVQHYHISGIQKLERELLERYLHQLK